MLAAQTCRQVGASAIIYFKENWKINFRDDPWQKSLDMLRRKTASSRPFCLSLGFRRMVLLAPRRLVPDPSKRQLSGKQFGFRQNAIRAMHSKVSVFVLV